MSDKPILIPYPPVRVSWLTVLIQGLTVLVLVLAIFILGVVAVEMIRLGPTLEITAKELHDTVHKTELTMEELRKGAKTWQQASKEQASATTLAMSNVDAAVERFTLFVSHTDASINSSLLPSLTDALQTQNASLLTTQKQLQANLQEMEYVTQQLQQTLADADKQIADPQVKIAIDNLATASQSVASATDHADKTMASVQQGVEYEVHEITKPVSAAKKAVLFIATLVGRFLGY